jgi:hypothetical protein
MSKLAFFRTADKGTIVFSSKSKKKEYKECTRKAPLPNLVAHKMIKKAAQEGKILHTYLCPHCHNWHLTHISQ